MPQRGRWTTSDQLEVGYLLLMATRNPGSTHQLRLVVFSQVFTGFLAPPSQVVGLRISEPSTAVYTPYIPPPVTGKQYKKIVFQPPFFWGGELLNFRGVCVHSEILFQMSWEFRGSCLNPNR